MSTTPPPAPPGNPGPVGDHDEGPRVTRDEMRDLGRLRRSVYNRKIAGVAGGLARHFDVDPVIVRVALVVLAFFGGAGVIVYAACWLLVPEEGAPEASVRLDDRSRNVALLLVGGFALLAILGDSLGGWGFPWPLAIVAVIAFLVLNSRRSSTTDQGTAYREEQPGPEAYSPGSTSGPPWHSTAAPGPMTGPPATEPFGPPPQPPHKRGPILFGFTLALVAVSLGVLAIVDLAGAGVPASAYPATALGLVGLMLVVGAFWGRAGGLIALGLVALLATVGATVGGEVDAGRIDTRPETAAAVDPTYDLFAGEIELDLTQVEDVENLDGRTIEAEVVFGRIDITLPAGVNAEVGSTIEGGGRTVLFGEEVEGSQDASWRGTGGGGPTVTIETSQVFGETEVDSADRNVS